MARRKLLLADDSITIQKVVNLTFAEEGIEVVTVGDGDSALARIGEEWPDLVMADVNMPGASGYQICEAIRSDSATRDIPVILLVGSFEPFDEAEAERVGATAFLTKPFNSIRQLVAQVSELIEARPAAPAEEPSLNGMTADPDAADRAEDIDALYDKSVSGEPTGEEIGHQGFGEGALDDEMIETSYIDPGAETVEFSVVEPDEEEEEIADHHAPVEAETPYSAEGPVERPAEHGDEVRHQESHQTVAETQEPHWASTPGEHGSAAAETAPNITEIPTEQFRVEESGISIPPADAADRNLAAQPHQGGAVEELFDDLSLLDLPPVGDEAAMKFVTPQEAAEGGTRERAVTISPALMEEIVNKVIERLAERS